MDSQIHLDLSKKYIMPFHFCDQNLAAYIFKDLLFRILLLKLVYGFSEIGSLFIFPVSLEIEILLPSSS